MPDRIAIFDPNVQLGAIIDTDEMRALGPVGGGPNAQAELTQFVELMPEPVWNLSTYDLAQAYLQFWQANFAALYEPIEPPSQPAMVEPADTPDDDVRLAEREAGAHTETPPAAPADADVEADTGTPDPYVGPCFACHGAGKVPGLESGSLVTCNLCHGTGALPAVVPAP